ncbi:MAG: aspartate aminotransferase family protein [Actinomycetota bacterium]
MTPVFPRAGVSLPTAVRAEGVWIEAADGKKYIDAAGGALVVSVGHGDPEILKAMCEQADRLSYVHASAFTTEALEAYAEELAPVLPFESPFVYPVSGGSEAVETAFKMARAYHLARGDEGRHKIISRWGSYHGNTRGALDASGRAPLRAPYLPWLDKSIHVPAVYEYRCPLMTHPNACGKEHAVELERVIEEEGPETVAAFIAEPIAGATLGAAVPPDDYWQAIAEVCNRHDVLLIADEVMTGFGRTGLWFGVDNWSVSPDIIVAGKGASSGYWPLGLAIASEPVGETVAGHGFVHGFTYSHNAVGAAVGRAVLRRLTDGDLVGACHAQGARLIGELRAVLADYPLVGDVRGRGLMIGIELVSDKTANTPFPRSRRAAETVVEAARERGLLLYHSTGCADGVNGDVIMLGPPFIVSNDVLDQIVSLTVEAVGVLR